MNITNIMKINIKKNKSGVSLIELMVAVAIFTVLILLATEIFKMVVDGQRSAISAQNVQESMRYAMEKMSREIRMAQIAGSCACGAADKRIFNTANNDQALCFKNKDSQCVNYYLENNHLKATVGAVTDFITPVKVKVSSLKFKVIDTLAVQPYVTMVMDVKASGPAATEQKMKIQMTASSRYYE